MHCMDATDIIMYLCGTIELHLNTVVLYTHLQYFECVWLLLAAPCRHQMTPCSLTPKAEVTLHWLSYKRNKCWGRAATKLMGSGKATTSSYLTWCHSLKSNTQKSNTLPHHSTPSPKVTTLQHTVHCVCRCPTCNHYDRNQSNAEQMISVCTQWGSKERYCS